MTKDTHPAGCSCGSPEFPEWQAAQEVVPAETMATNEYYVEHTYSGYAVYRSDGAYAEFLDSSEAEAFAKQLNEGEISEDEDEDLWNHPDD